MARDYARRAGLPARGGALAQGGAPPNAVRRPREALELAVKALPRAPGVEYPRGHGASDALPEDRERLPGG